MSSLSLATNGQFVRNPSGRGATSGMSYALRRFFIQLAFGCGLLLFACGDDDGATFHSGVDRGKSLTDLTPSERDALCAEGERYWSSIEGEVRDGACRWVGHIATIFSPSDEAARADCRAAYDSCLRDPEDSTEELESPTTCPSFQCTAAVGQFEDCLNDSGDALRSYLDAVPSCESARAGANGTIPSGEPARSEACRALEANCS